MTIVDLLRSVNKTLLGKVWGNIKRKKKKHILITLSMLLMGFGNCSKDFELQNNAL
jgi:hypothetical protein